MIFWSYFIYFLSPLAHKDREERRAGNDEQKEEKKMERTLEGRDGLPAPPGFDTTMNMT